MARHSDHLGSTSVLSDADGLRVEGSEVVYAPFGEVRIGEQTDLTDFGFTGQRLDESTGGLMYYGARYYLPSLRRFISADTIVPGAGNPQALNRYAYVFNNPVNLIDPTGHRPPTEEEEQWWGMDGYHSGSGSKSSGGGNAADGVDGATGGGGSGGGGGGGGGGNGGNRGGRGSAAYQGFDGFVDLPRRFLYWGNLTEAELAAYQEQQSGNDCAACSIAAAYRMLGHNTSCDWVAFLANIRPAIRWDGNGVHIDPYSYRWLENWAIGPAQQARLASDMAASAEWGASAEWIRGASTEDLRGYLQQPDTVVLVTIAYSQDDPFENMRDGVRWETIPDPEGPLPVAAHTMVLAAYDANHPGGPWGFINSWESSTLTWVSDQEFQDVWGATSNLGVMGSNNAVIINANP